MSHFTVVYDACVLYPAPLRDLLVRLARTGLFRARWTDTIHDEWIRNVLKDRPDIPSDRLARTRDLMNQYIPDCLVTGYEKLVEGLSLPDPNDRHVLAAAICSQAQEIVTFNLKDFPDSKLDEFDVTAIHPDNFVTNLYDLNPGAVIQAVKQQRAGLKNPVHSADEFIEIIRKQQLLKTASILEEFINVI